MTLYSLRMNSEGGQVSRWFPHDRDGWTKEEAEQVMRDALSETEGIKYVSGELVPLKSWNPPLATLCVALGLLGNVCCGGGANVIRLTATDLG